MKIPEVAHCSQCPIEFKRAYKSAPLRIMRNEIRHHLWWKHNLDSPESWKVADEILKNVTKNKHARALND